MTIKINSDCYEYLELLAELNAQFDAFTAAIDETTKILDMWLGGKEDNVAWLYHQVL